jgi:hypothetical protein
VFRKSIYIIWHPLGLGRSVHKAKDIKLVRATAVRPTEFQIKNVNHIQAVPKGAMDRKITAMINSSTLSGLKV